MILVYVCPFCKEVRIVSRRKEVNCLVCDHEMILSDLTFLEWTQMSESQRKAYGALWDKRNKIKNESSCGHCEPSRALQGIRVLRMSRKPGQE